jgi:hypothetical protein
MIPPGVIHNARNIGTVNTKMLSTYVGWTRRNPSRHSSTVEIPRKKGGAILWTREAAYLDDGTVAGRHRSIHLRPPQRRGGGSLDKGEATSTNPQDVIARIAGKPNHEG